MDVELWDQIPDPGDVDPGIAQGAQGVRNARAIGQNRVPVRGRQIQEIGQIGFGDQDEPGHGAVAMQQQVGRGQAPEPMTVGPELGMEGEGRHDDLESTGWAGSLWNRFSVERTAVKRLLVETALVDRFIDLGAADDPVGTHHIDRRLLAAFERAEDFIDQSFMD
jgi:hypothetical protein